MKPKDAARILDRVPSRRSMVKYAITALIVYIQLVLIHVYWDHIVATSHGGVKRGLSLNGRYCRDRQPIMEIAPGRNKNQYTSQFGQDRWLERNVLEFIPDDSNPRTFVEFGARDGRDQSNTHKWDTVDGYSGILIEAQSREYEILRKNRERHGAVFTYHNIVVCHP